MSGSTRLSGKTLRLVEAAVSATAASRECIVDLSENLLAGLAAGEEFRHDVSALNNDGAPLQLCFSSGQRAYDLRLIADPGTHLDDPRERFRVSEDTLRRCFKTSGAESWIECGMNSFARLLPRTDEERSAYRHGYVWIAAGVGKPGLAFYVEAQPLGRARAWETARSWLRSVLTEHHEAGALIDKLSTSCELASFGLEGASHESVRAKLYFRLAKSAPLESLGIPLLREERMARFLSMAMGRFGVDLDGLVLCVGFSLASGQLLDAKIDLCGHCLSYAPDEWPRVLRAIEREFDLTHVPVSDLIANGVCDVAFVGFGLDTSANARLNIYLKASDPDGTPETDELNNALHDGVRYLCDLQEPDGQWRDYALPVGASNQWVTAYVGYSLARCATLSGNPLAASAAKKAVEWLTENKAYSDGWGYNDTTGPDADSTAITMALLRELGQPTDSVAAEYLRTQWRTDAGIATYSAPNAWGQAHWDVTPLAYLALGGEDQERLKDEFFNAMLSNRIPGGMWRSYWWRNPYYSTYITLDVLRQLHLAEPVGLPASVDTVLRADNAFDLSCLIGTRCLRGAGREELGAHLRGLLRWQAADGRWPGAANLRVTDDQCYAPWDAPIGEYFSDQLATITTATVVGMLAMLLSRETSVLPKSPVPTPRQAPRACASEC